MKTGFFAVLRKFSWVGVLCAVTLSDVEKTRVHSSDIDYQVRQVAERFLGSEGFGPYNIPERLKPDFQIRLEEIKRELKNLINIRWGSFIELGDVERVVHKKLRSFVNNIRSVVKDYQLETVTETAIREYLYARGISREGIPSQHIYEYNNCASSILRKLRSLMWRDGRDYVRTFEIEKAIQDEMNSFVRKVSNFNPYSPRDWWNYFFGGNNTLFYTTPVNTTVTTPPVHISVQPSAPPLEAFYSVPTPVYQTPVIQPSAPAFDDVVSSSDINKIMRRDLDEQVLQAAYKVFRANGIDPDNIPARVISDYGDKIQRIIQTMKDNMIAHGCDYVWRDDLEQAAFQELQSIIDTINYKSEECSICLDGYNRGQRVGILSCGHFFHKDCIYTWLDRQKTCPFCRQNNVIVAQQEVVS